MSCPLLTIGSAALLPPRPLHSDRRREVDLVDMEHMEQSRIHNDLSPRDDDHESENCLAWCLDGCLLTIDDYRVHLHLMALDLQE